ncbi:DNA-directed RNA polymerase II 16 kDa subunit [Plasmodium ovale wallikeri]|uniref:DNA-directed RNA polymerase II 16 kDa subunit n=1 Tax=Plasmodium ovale wallikeri TaxID=864142 RepID=A0A1A8YKF0_PLAOA|nr:DNA-directed RNA polymerase II 16 kDa subunit [Plasmodium ovale wallikeri]SBT58775.1 DNA-directed RNA polymerase II 16 kDa subunit [Plasmodium ovale wallikeri]
MANNLHGDIKSLDLGPGISRDGMNCEPNITCTLCESASQVRCAIARDTSFRFSSPCRLIKSSFDYANKFATIKSRSSIVDVRTNLERIGELHEYEIAMLVNLLPKTVQEARYFIPSLIRLNDETLNSILEHLISYKMYVS